MGVLRSMLPGIPSTSDTLSASVRPVISQAAPGSGTGQTTLLMDPRYFILPVILHHYFHVMRLRITLQAAAIAFSKGKGAKPLAKVFIRANNL
jgi:hypothetical protein